MTDRDESDKYNGRDSENEEVRNPSVAMLRVTINRPHPVCITKLFFMLKTLILMM